MSTPDTTGSNDSARDASLSHLPDHIRRAIETTPAAGIGERIIDIATRGRRTGRARRIEIFFYRAAGATYLCSGAGGAATDWHANLLADPGFTFHPSAVIPDPSTDDLLPGTGVPPRHSPQS
ncbi:nitroreductase/quinone reductase family protein [Streptomyces sp. Agncl-13]|uniref:nitroreductase/quinone reductase family protein n=1 Tax=Streptomyces sp. Agncl-13 TaxID=3400628 RepID=UPI003A8725F0